MKLTQLQTHGVQGVEDGTYELDGDVVAILGGRGSGRGRLLRALAMAKEAVGGYGTPIDLKPWARAGANESWARARWTFTEKERKFIDLPDADCEIQIQLPGGAELRNGFAVLRRLFLEYDRSGQRGRMEFFPARRALEPGPGGAALLHNPMLHLSDNGSKYSGVAQIIADAWINARLESGEEPYSAGIESLVPGLRLESAEVVRGTPRLSFNRGSASLMLEDLEPDEQQAVLFVAVIFGLKLRDSVLLVEEPELHIGAAEEEDWVRKLAQLEPSNQLILATGSERVAKAAQQVIRLEPRASRPSFDAEPLDLVPPELAPKKKNASVSVDRGLGAGLVDAPPVPKTSRAHPPGWSMSSPQPPTPTDRSTLPTPGQPAAFFTSQPPSPKPPAASAPPPQAPPAAPLRAAPSSLPQPRPVAPQPTPSTAPVTPQQSLHPQPSPKPLDATQAIDPSKAAFPDVSAAPQPKPTQPQPEQQPQSQPQPESQPQPQPEQPQLQTAEGQQAIPMTPVAAPKQDQKAQQKPALGFGKTQRLDVGKVGKSPNLAGTKKIDLSKLSIPTVPKPPEKK